MSVNIHAPGFYISATSGASQRIQITVRTKFVLVVNGTTNNLCFVNAGNSTVTSTTANAAVGGLQSRLFEIDQNNDTHVSVLPVGTASAHICIIPTNSSDQK